MYLVFLLMSSLGMLMMVLTMVVKAVVMVEVAGAVAFNFYILKNRFKTPEMEIKG